MDRYGNRDMGDAALDTYIATMKAIAAKKAQPKTATPAPAPKTESPGLVLMVLVLLVLAAVFFVVRRR